MTGIYKITNQINGKSYIGQSIDIIGRWNRHRSYAQKEDSPLYYAIRKYGIENFIFEVIEECSLEALNEREIYWISYYNTYYDGYNQTTGGQGNANYVVKLTDEQIQEIVDKLQNSNMTQREIAKMYSVGEDTISEINQGKTRIQAGISYPIRKNWHKTISKCAKCGKQICNGSKLCVSCNGLANRQVNRPDRDTLKYLIRTKSFVEIGKMFNVSDNAIRRWCDAEHLPRKKTEIKQYTDEEWAKI